MRLYLSSSRLGNRPDELLRLVGGRKRTAIILNADDFKSPKDRNASLQREAEDLGAIGLVPAEVDLRDYFDEPERLRETLISYDLVWVRGGNVYILGRAFRQSGANRVIKELLAADSFVYSGYSAGAVMLTPSLRGVELVDDPYQVPFGYEAGPPEDGLAILPYAIAPHYQSDHPESERVEKYVRYLIDHHVLFIALRDGQAIVRDGNREAIVG